MGNKVLVTGTNRGIGLALVKQYVQRGDEVFAGCRRPDEAEELNQFAAANPQQVRVFRLDVTRSESTAAGSQFVWSHTETLDILINNAGINPESSAQTKLVDLELQDCRDAFEVNVLGPARVTRAMLPLLEKGDKARVVNIASVVFQTRPVRVPTPTERRRPR